MSRGGYFVRLALSVMIDLLDFTLGRTLFLLPWEEGVGAIVLTLLWGWPGILYLGEVADFTEQFDAFIPSATLIALLVGWRKGFLFGGGAAREPKRRELKR